MKTCSARNPFSFCQDASFVSLPLYSSWLHCQLTRQQRFVSHELQLSRMKSEAWWSLRIFVWVSDHSRSRDDLCWADKKNCGRTEQCGQDKGKTACECRAVLQPILLIATVLQWKGIWFKGMIKTLVAYFAAVLEWREVLRPSAPPTIIATGCSDALYIVGAFANQDPRYYILCLCNFSSYHYLFW